MPNREDYTLALHLKADAKQATGATRSAVETIKRQVASGASALQKMFYATALVKTGIGAVAAAARALNNALGPASALQQYSIQLEVLLGNAGKASQRLRELSRFAKETNFSPEQIFEAGNLMQAFGIYSKRSLELAGDAANAFGKDIREVVTSINYLASGRGGEAFESLARLGITRQKLSAYGVRFGRAGNLLTPAKDAVNAVFKYMERNFGGMTRRQANTWRGIVQQLGGEWWDMLSRAFGGALRPLTGFVKNSLIPAITALGDAAEKLDWGKILGGPLRVIGGFVNMLAVAADPATRAVGLGQLKAFGKAFLESLGKIGKGVMKDTGSFALNVIPKIFANGAMMLYHSLAAVFQFGAAILDDQITAAGFKVASFLTLSSRNRRIFEQAAQNLEAGAVSHRDLYMKQAQTSLQASMESAKGIADAFTQWGHPNTSAAIGEARSTLSGILEQTTAFGYGIRSARARKRAAEDAYRDAAARRREALLAGFKVAPSNGVLVPYAARKGAAAEQARREYYRQGNIMNRALWMYRRMDAEERRSIRLINKGGDDSLKELPGLIDTTNGTLSEMVALLQGVLAYPGVTA